MKLTSPYTLPELSIIGGSTQQLLFDVYYGENDMPFNLAECTAYFSLINFVNKTGVPIISKKMETVPNGSSDTHTLRVTLAPSETVDCAGKYVYQITINDLYGNYEQVQGIMVIYNNIDKSRISQEV